MGCMPDPELGVVAARVEGSNLVAPDNRRASAREISRAGRTRTSASCSRSRGAAVEHHGPNVCSSSTGTRTPVSALRGRRPGQLADGARTSTRPWNRTTNLRHIRPTGRPPTPAAHVQLPARDSNSHDRLNRAASCRWTSWERNGRAPRRRIELRSPLRQRGVCASRRPGRDRAGRNRTHSGELRARYAACTSRLRAEGGRVELPRREVRPTVFETAAGAGCRLVLPDPRGTSRTCGLPGRSGAL